MIQNAGSYGRWYSDPLAQKRPPHGPHSPLLLLVIPTGIRRSQKQQSIGVVELLQPSIIGRFFEKVGISKLLEDLPVEPPF